MESLLTLTESLGLDIDAISGLWVVQDKNSRGAVYVCLNMQTL